MNDHPHPEQPEQPMVTSDIATSTSTAQTISPDAVLWMVDDNPADLELVAIVCETIAFPGTFVPFRNGLHALARLDEVAGTPAWWPDVVLLDINMPQTSGLSVLRQIRSQSRWSTLPVVMFTSSANEEAVARREGATDYLLKPSALAGLVHVIRRVVEQRCKHRRD